MSKRASLFAVKSSAPPINPEKAPTTTATGEQAGIRSRRPPSRDGKRVLTIYLDPLAWKQLRLLALENDTTTQALGEEAINLLFASHQINRSA
jgi:hypothetical protein